MASIKDAPAENGPSIFMRAVRKDAKALDDILKKLNKDIQTIEKRVGEIEEGGITSDIQLIMASLKEAGIALE